MYTLAANLAQGHSGNLCQYERLRVCPSSPFQNFALDYGCPKVIAVEKLRKTYTYTTADSNTKT